MGVIGSGSGTPYQARTQHRRPVRKGIGGGGGTGSGTVYWARAPPHPLAAEGVVSGSGTAYQALTPHRRPIA